jgi:hypothetical protein
MQHYLLAQPSDISTVAQGGQILAHVRNYTRIYPIADGLPPNADGGKCVYRIEVPDHQINKVNEGPVVQTLLWDGNKDGRDNKNQLVTVTILPVSLPVDPVLAEKVNKIMQQVLDLEKALADERQTASAMIATLQAELTAAKVERSQRPAPKVVATPASTGQAAR